MANIKIEAEMKDLTPDSSTADIQAPPMTKIDKILMAFVIVAIIAVIVFQVVDYTQGQANPVINIDSNVTTPRTFPGILVCPFSLMQNYYAEVNGDCPVWQRDAVLSFDAAFNGGFAPSFMTVANSNVDAGSKRQDKNVCPDNNGLWSENAKREAGFLFFEKSMVSGGLFASDSQTYRKVLIQNTSPPTYTRKGKACNSWTPPNVECWMFDPRHFKSDRKCNPMSEIRANSQDALLLNFPAPNMCNFKYTGLIPQPESVFFKDAPETLSLPYLPYETKTAKNLESSIFGGVVAVLYDASKSPPASLNFDGALTNYLIISSTDQNSTGTNGAVVVDNAMASMVLTSTACFSNGNPDNLDQACVKRRADPLLAVVTQEFDFLLNKNVLTKQSVSISKSNIDRLRFSRYNQDEFDADVTIMFSSSVSVGRYQVSKVSLLTTLSIIVSTAATLWGSQEKIKEFIEKAQLFVAKRRARA